MTTNSGSTLLDRCSGKEAGVLQACTSSACRGPSDTPQSLYGKSVVMEGCSVVMLLYTIHGIRSAQTEGDGAVTVFV